MKWTKKGFEEFSNGTMGNGGQNIYVSAKGTLQRVFHFDVNGDGYPDIPITNSHSMNECPYIHVYDEMGQEKPLELPTNGSFDAVFADLNGNGTDDLIVACQHNGVHTDISAIIYFGSEQGLCEKYKTELRVPNSTGVAVGDFNGSGKKAIAFNSGNKLRVFYQHGYGIEASVFDEIDVAAISLAAGDLDGDGYDDLFIIRPKTGDVAVLWGGPEGLNAEDITIFGKQSDSAEDSRGSSTTAGRKFLRWLTWRCNVLQLKDKVVTFRVEDNFAVFESFGADRQPHEEFRVECKKPEEKAKKFDAYFFGYGPAFATAGDLSNDGSHDIIIAVATDFENVDDAIILWEKENYSIEKAGKLPLQCPRVLSVGKFGPDDKNRLFVGRSCEMDKFDVDASVYLYNGDGTFTKEWTIPASEPTRVLSGKTYTDGRRQLVVINHEGEKKLGLEEAYIFLGGPDGYKPERRLEFPTAAGVDTIMADFNDDGLTDVLVAGCAENAGYLTKGLSLYWQDENGFDPQNNFTRILCAEGPHGMAVGDFRKSGYLDIISSSLGNRDVKIFEGGPNGYDFEHPTKMLVMGPNKEEYLEKYAKAPYSHDLHEEKSHGMTAEERSEHGNTRWLFAADFNGDGYLDLFISQIVGKKSYIFWGGPDGFNSENYQLIATDGISGANAADLDGDGYLDLVCSGHLSLKHTMPSEYGKFVIYWGGPDGFQEHRKTQLPSPCCNALTIHDFNGDGLLDIYGTAYSNTRCRDIDSKMYFQTPDRMFHQDNFQNIFNHSGCGCLAGDFNGDGYVDLAVASHKAYGNHVNSSYIFWGGPDGINEQRYTELPCRGPHGMCSVDIGNIVDRGDEEYYYSEAFRIPEGMKPTKASWEATLGVKNWVKMQIRCADTAEELEHAPWQGDLSSGDCLCDLNLKGYIQYKLALGAKCGCGTPRITSVTIDFA